MAFDADKVKRESNVFFNAIIAFVHEISADAEHASEGAIRERMNSELRGAATAYLKNTGREANGRAVSDMLRLAARYGANAIYSDENYDAIHAFEEKKQRLIARFKKGNESMDKLKAEQAILMKEEYALNKGRILISYERRVVITRIEVVGFAGTEELWRWKETSASTNLEAIRDLIAGKFKEPPRAIWAAFVSMMVSVAVASNRLKIRQFGNLVGWDEIRDAIITLHDNDAKAAAQKASPYFEKK